MYESGDDMYESGVGDPRKQGVPVIGDSARGGVCWGCCLGRLWRERSAENTVLKGGLAPKAFGGTHFFGGRGLNESSLIRINEYRVLEA